MCVCVYIYMYIYIYIYETIIVWSLDKRVRLCLYKMIKLHNFMFILKHA